MEPTIADINSEAILSGRPTWRAIGSLERYNILPKGTDFTK